MFEIERKDGDSRARTGFLRTEHGAVETPAYVIVGTHAEVRCLKPEDLPLTKTQLIIANTYHLWRTLGEEGLSEYPGLHRDMQWSGPMMTDSGGFQVFSLGFLKEQGLRRGGSAAIKTSAGKPEAGLRLAVAGSGRAKAVAAKSTSSVRVTEAGVYFHPEGEGEEESYLDAETSVRIQEQLGADIIVAFDEPTSPLHGLGYTRAAMERTHRWAERSLEAKRSNQKMYGVVQGGAFEDLRSASAKFIGGMPFDGFAIGSTYGDAYGGTKVKTGQMLEWSVPHLPENRPRHLFGVGRVEDVFAGVAAGIDTFDCVIPTREARHGGVWTAGGRFDVKKGANRGNEHPLDPECRCPVCLNGTSRRDLHLLFKDKNPEAGRLATLHNVYFFNDLLEKIRAAVREGRLEALRKEYLVRMAPEGAVDNFSADPPDFI